MMKSFGASSEVERVGAPSKTQVGLFCLLLIVTLALCISDYGSFLLGTSGDDASYAVLAQSIASSDRYGLVNVPGQPQQTRFPFGYPLLLSPFAKLFPDNPDLMKLGSLLATLLNASLLFVGWPYLSQRKSYWWGLMVAGLYSTSPLVIGHTRMVMSEPAFTTLVLAALILTERHLSKGKDTWHPLQGLLLGAIAALALFIRTLGVALWIAIVVRVLLALPLHKSLRMLGYLFGGGLALVIAVVVLTPIAIPDLVPAEYADQFREPHAWGQTQIETALIPRVLSAFTSYAKQDLREVVLPAGGGDREQKFGRRLGIADLPLLTGLGIAGVILLGGLSFLWKQGVSPTAYLFVILYFGAILLWPWRGARFLYPIQPFLQYQFVLGPLLVLSQLKRTRLLSPRASSLLVPSALGAVILAMLLASLYKVSAGSWNSLEHTRDLRVGAAWLRENSPPDAVVMAQQAQSVYLYSQRKTVDYPRIANPAELETAIHEQGVDYILVAPVLTWRADGSLEYDEYTRATFLPSLNTLSATGGLKLVYESEEDMVLIYRIGDGV